MAYTTALLAQYRSSELFRAWDDITKEFPNLPDAVIAEVITRLVSVRLVGVPAIQDFHMALGSAALAAVFVDRIGCLNASIRKGKARKYRDRKGFDDMAAETLQEMFLRFQVDPFASFTRLIQSRRDGTERFFFEDEAYNVIRQVFRRSHVVAKKTMKSLDEASHVEANDSGADPREALEAADCLQLIRAAVTPLEWDVGTRLLLRRRGEPDKIEAICAEFGVSRTKAYEFANTVRAAGGRIAEEQSWD